MAGLKISERTRIALLAADRSRRRTLSRVLGSRLLRWKFGRPFADQLLIVPQDLRTADPSFFREIELGEFGLAGTVASIGDDSPFDLVPPNEAWARALHGFGWLRHLEAVGTSEAKDTARQLALEWTVRNGGGRGIAAEPAVAGRRLISWLSHAGMLLENTDTKTYEALARSLGADLVRLSAGWRDGTDGYPRLLALTSLVLSDLCIAGHDRQLSETERVFSAEINRQILPDGGHISRNPGVPIDIMLDLLPLKQCFASRGRVPPPALISAMNRMLAMLRFMRLGDGSLARFNGMSVAVPAALSTVLAYGDQEVVLPLSAPATRYSRAECNGSILIMDTGPPPPLEVAGRAHAGCLSFEFSTGMRPILVNGGAPGSAETSLHAEARATASHNTLCLGETSSSRLIRHGTLEALVGGVPLRGPNKVAAHVEVHGGGIEIEASHDGYQKRYNLLHRRRLALAASGRRLLGIDTVTGPRGRTRLRVDLPFAIHFHLHPDVACVRGSLPGTALLTLTNGERWSFSVEGALLSIEESTFYADAAGAANALQIVARGATFGDSEVRWLLEAQS